MNLLKNTAELPYFLRNPREAMELYKNPSCYVVLDYETTNTDFGSAVHPDNQIVLACWDVVTPEGVVTKHKFGDEYNQEELFNDVMEADFIVSHNAKFELQWLRRMGVDLHDVFVYDTYLAEWVIQSNRRLTNLLNLEDTAKRYGLGTKRSIVSYLIDKGICPSEIPQEWLLDYCYQDVLLAREVYKKQIDVLVNENLLHLAFTRNLCCPVLADMEFNPQHLDKQNVTELYEQKVNEFQKLENELGTFTGGINLNSPKQKIEFFYETMGFDPPKDKKGNIITTGKSQQPSTKADVLAMLKPKNKRQELFLSLQAARGKLNALLTKNLSFFKACVEELDGKFYGIFNQGFTDTGRLSGSGRKVKLKAFKEEKGPQLQNLPRDFKYLFTSHNPDEEVWSFDAASLEFRVAADLGNDDLAREEIESGFDVHSYTAKVLTEAGESTTRQDAKKSTFAPLYGGGGQTTAQKAYAKAFKEKYSGIATTQQGWTMQVAATGALRTPYGMKFYWPGTKISRSGYVDNTTQIYNYPVQGFATGEIIPIALVHFWHRTREAQVELFNTVHDSIVARVNRSVDAEWLKSIVVQSMTHDVFSWLNEVYGYAFKTSLGVGLKIGKSWDVSDIEMIWDVTPSGTTTYREKN